MKSYMVFFCVVWAALAFFFYRGLYISRERRKISCVFAESTVKAVRENFVELKLNSKSMVISKGYGVIDDSQWKGEVKRFVSEVVVSYVGKSLMMKAREKAWGRTLFAVLAYRIVIDLMKYDAMPDDYDARSLIDGLEDKQDALAFFKGELKFRGAAEGKAGLAMAFVLVGLSGGAGDVMAAEGEAFSPIDACNVLADEDGYQPGRSGYSELSGDSYSCATPYKDLSDSLMPNNIALYARGRPTEVTRVKLMLNVNERQNAGRDTKTLARLCEKMVITLAGSAPAGFKAKVQAGKPFKSEFSGYNLYLNKTVWPTGKGFELNCGIATKDHKE